MKGKKILNNPIVKFAGAMGSSSTHMVSTHMDLLGGHYISIP